MSPRPLLALLPLVFSITPAFADQLDCTTLGPKTTLADLQKLYGKANVVTGEVDGPEGTTMIATTIFPKEADKTFMVYWFDEEKHERLAGFTVPEKDTGPGGVKIGMTIKDVQTLNGEPFTLQGFYWDYGGAAGFQSGKLANLPGGCYLNLTFEPSKDSTDAAISDAISGDRELRSDLKEFDTVLPVVTAMDIGYADPEASAD